jgi:hypothetical protein
MVEPTNEGLVILKRHIVSLLRNDAKLLTEASGIGFGSMLGDFAFRDPVQADAVPLHMLSGRGMPISGPWWVPSSAIWLATLSPSASMSSTVACKSGKAMNCPLKNRRLLSTPGGVPGGSA